MVSGRQLVREDKPVNVQVGRYLLASATVPRYRLPTRHSVTDCSEAPGVPSDHNSFSLVHSTMFHVYVPVAPCLSLVYMMSVLPDVVLYDP